MAQLPRFAKQRSVQRNTFKKRFTVQRQHRLGWTTTTLPTLASIAPTTVVHGAAAGTVTCTGTNFVSGVTKVTVNGRDRPTTFVSATVVTAPYTPSATAGSNITVNVHNGEKISTTPKTLTVT
jgi:hypothetical protein